MTKNILVIKHGAFGDTVQAVGHFQALRKHHKNDRLILLTTPPYKDLMEKMGCFDAVWTDQRKALWTFDWRRLKKRIEHEEISRIYDLQNSDRTGFYFKMLGKPKPEWCGIAAGCSHPQNLEGRRDMHNVDRLDEQIKIAGVKPVKAADFSWLGQGRDMKVQKPYAILIPGASKGKTFKRWPYFIELANKILEHDVVPVFIGSDAERNLIPEIEQRCLRAEILIGQTSFDDLADLARDAEFFVGNDTGPAHLIAALGVKGVMLFAEASEPHRCAPKSKKVISLIGQDLQSDILLEDVLRKISFD